MKADVAATKALADEFVAASTDPDRAMVAFVKAWALGAAISDDARDDVLDDLVGLAVAAALAHGLELSLPEVLDDLGEHQRAQRIRDAVEAGRAAFIEAAARAGRLHDVVAAREAA